MKVKNTVSAMPPLFGLVWSFAYNMMINEHVILAIMDMRAHIEMSYPDMTKLVNLSLDRIMVREGVRKSIGEESIQELSTPFTKHDVLQPVLVQLLDRLGEIYINEGIEPGKIAYKIAEETG